MSKFLINAVKSGAWPFIEANKILEHIDNKTPQKGYVLFETGYGPSGLPHIGTFCEVARTVMVRSAFEKISDIPTKLICFSDDMDGFRKVPTNIPNQEMLQDYLNMPLTAIPDPFVQEKSYGDYMNKKLCSFLDRFDFKYDFMSATECYKTGQFDHMMIKVLENYQQIMNLMLPTFRAERRSTYSPFMPICPNTGRVLEVLTNKIDTTNHTISYIDPVTKKEMVVSVLKGNCKLQWKPDFGMRWAALGVDYEMYGKDHMPNARIYSEICEILGGARPIQYFFEFFLNEQGEKISKSKGKNITVDQWLLYAPLESMKLFIYHNPSKAKRLHFDVIPSSVDEYIKLNKKYFLEEDEIKKLGNPVYHVHEGQVPEIETFDISFGLLLNLASVCNPDNKEVLWRFISKYMPQANANHAPYLDHLAGFAINYYNDFIKANKVYLAPTEQHKVVLTSILQMLETTDSNEDSEEIQKKIYAIGREAGYDNLRDYFKDLYQIIFGQTEGPRLGSFFKLYGLEETKSLLREKIK